MVIHPPNQINRGMSNCLQNKRIRGYNSINIKFGYKQLEIRSPREFENMKTSDKTKEKQFDSVDFMREQRTKLNEKLSKMTKQEIVEYFKKRKTETKTNPSA
ncbi:hypothetical protein BH23BAC1_BH23BAC1_28450 [soil metagenome]